ncbi:MAG TPA: hypothetical protein VF212_17585 [Longimicrobiales bacterium]
MLHEYTYVHPDTGEAVYVQINASSAVVEDVYTFRNGPFAKRGEWRKGRSSWFVHAADPFEAHGRLIAEGYVCPELGQA